MDVCSASYVRLIVLLCIAFTLCGLIYFGYFCSDRDCALTLRSAPYLPLPPSHPRQPRPPPQKPISTISNSASVASSVAVASRFSSSSSSSYSSSKAGDRISFDKLLISSVPRFNIRRPDVIVFLHIQKTGGTSFGRHLVQDLDLEKPCDCHENRKKCRCTRPQNDDSYWLFSRYSTGWRCGLHADWTELTNCVAHVLDQQEIKKRKRRYFYVTLLRDPVHRFLSEFLHVQRGATWKQARHWCGGREASPAELPPCFHDETWEDVQLDEFMSCSSNLAINRQTRMLADLKFVGCYNTSLMSPSERDAVMLSSAKENLRDMAFFGLCEQQQISQYLFETSFDMHFITQFQQFDDTHVASLLKDVTPGQIQQIRQLNHLDVELYEYAVSLLMQRFEHLKKTNSNFERDFKSLGRLRRTDFRWEDIED